LVISVACQGWLSKSLMPLLLHCMLPFLGCYSFYSSSMGCVDCYSFCSSLGGVVQSSTVHPLSTQLRLYTWAALQAAGVQGGGRSGPGHGYSQAQQPSTFQAAATQTARATGSTSLRRGHSVEPLSTVLPRRGHRLEPLSTILMCTADSLEVWHCQQIRQATIHLSLPQLF
jgi:hypothetical protein